MKNESGAGCSSVKKAPMIYEIMSLLGRVADNAENTALRVADKLSGVCHPIVEESESNVCQDPSKYPLLLRDMWEGITAEGITAIEARLAQINDTLNRCEL